MTTEEKLAQHIGIPVEIRDIPIRGRVVHYATCGSGEPLLLLHGGTFGWGAWHANIPTLAKRFTVYAMDLPGSGRSSSTDYTKPHFYEDVVDIVSLFVDALKLQPLTVLGHSFGGWVAMRLAADSKNFVRKLALIDATGFGAHASLPELVLSLYPVAWCVSKTLLKPQRQNAMLEKFLRSAFYNPYTELPVEFIDYFYENMRRSHNLLFVSRLIAARKELDARNIFPGITCPTLIVWGEHDAIIPMQTARARFKDIPHARVEIIAGAGHVPQIEQASVFNERIASFLYP